MRLYGTGFTESGSDELVPPSAIDSVTFGDAKVTVGDENVVPGRARAEVPSGPSGPVEVTLWSEGVSATAPNPFTVLTEGEIAFSADGSLEGVKLNSADWGDFDGDGNLDLAIAGERESGAPVVTIYRNGGGGSFEPLQGELPPRGGDPDGISIGVRNGSVEWGDHDGDGTLDLVVTGRTGTGERIARVYRNEGGGSFSDIKAGLPGVLYGDAGWGDVDGDGDLDLAVVGDAGPEGPIAKLYENEGGGFSEAGAGLTGVAFGSVDWGSYVGVGSSQQLVITGSTGDGERTTVYDPLNSSVDQQLTGVTSGEARWGDVDDDEDLDLAVVGNNGDAGRSALIYRTSTSGASGSLERTGAGLSGVSGGSVAWGDFDGDGDLDLVVAGEGKTEEGGKQEAKVYRNDDGPFVPLEVGLAGVALSSVSSADYNGDGKADLLLSGYDGSSATTMLYENVGASGDTDILARETASVGSDQAVEFGGIGVRLSFSGVRGSGPLNIAEDLGGHRPEAGIEKPVVRDGRFLVRASENLKFETVKVTLPRADTGRGLSPRGLSAYRRSPPAQGPFTLASEDPEVTPSGVTFTTGKLGEFALASSAKGPLVQVKSLGASFQDETVRVVWETSSTAERVDFQAQRRAAGSGGAWTDVETISGKSEAASYRATDEAPPYSADSLEYRLRQLGSGDQAYDTRAVTVTRALPAQAKLQAPYPNPAKTQVSVQYALPERRDVTLRLYDVLGRRVRTLKTSGQKGRHEAQFDVSSLSSGAYFLRFVAGETTETRRVTIVQ